MAPHPLRVEQGTNRRDIVVRKIKYGLLIIGLVILMALLYLSLHGFPDSVTRKVERQLQFSGLVVSLDRIKLGVFEGIIASRVFCHRKGDIGDPVFEAEKIVLHISPWRWMRGEHGVTGGRIKNGMFRLWVAGGAGGKGDEAGGCPRMLVFDRLQALVTWDSLSEIRVEDFSTRLPGIQVTGRGTFSLPAPSAAEPGAPAPAAAGPAEDRISPLVLDVLRACREVRLNNTLNAEVIFQADAEDVRKLDLHVKLDSRDTRVGRSGVGAWRAQVGVRGMAARGVLEIKDGTIQGIPLEQATCRFSCDEESVVVERLEAVVGHGAGKGRLNLSLHYDWKSGSFQGRWASEADPRALLPVVRQDCPAHAWILEAFRFPRRPPELKAAFRGRWKPGFSFELDGLAHADDMAYREVSLSEARAAATVAAGTNGLVVNLAPLVAVRPEGSGQGWLRVDLRAPAVIFDASSTLNPYALAQMIDPFVDRLVRQFRFEGPVQAAGWGTFGFVDTTLDDIDLAVEARHAGWQKFLADRCALDLHLAGDHTEITDIRGTIYGGHFDARASVYRVPGSPIMRYETEAEVADIEFSRMIEVLAGKAMEPFAGKISAQVAVEGAIGEGQGQATRGRGWVKIEDGHLFQVPLFGGLSDFLVRIIPGMGSLMRQTDGQASFVIGDGKIHADEILVEGDVFSLVGKGDYALDGTLDFTVQVKLLRKDNLAADVFRFVTQPFSKLLEFHLGGTVAAPQWRPVNIPKEVFLIFD